MRALHSPTYSGGVRQTPKIKIFQKRKFVALGHFSCQSLPESPESCWSQKDSVENAPGSAGLLINIPP